MNENEVSDDAKGYGFVACSGAETKHITDEWFKSEPKQLDKLREFIADPDQGEPDIITLSIGGNDAGSKPLSSNAWRSNAVKIRLQPRSSTISTTYSTTSHTH